MDPIKVEPVILSGCTVRLEPLAESHTEGLRAAAEDERIWPYMSTDAHGGGMDRFVATALKARDAGTDLPFTVRLLSDDRIVGSTRYLNIAPVHRRLEIGNTWYAPAVWASQVNPECKLLLLRHAFEAIGAFRVELRCDARNARSRAAILKLGAVEEGVLRRHMKMQHDFWRDTVQFAILDREWPGVKAGLERRLAD